jgi:hypothetical protein
LELFESDKVELSSPEIIKLLETLRIKELISKSQLTAEEADRLDDEIKQN